MLFCLYLLYSHIKGTAKNRCRPNTKEEEDMLKKTKATIIFALTAMLAAGSITVAAGKAVAAQGSENLLQSYGAEKLFYCETDHDYKYANDC